MTRHLNHILYFLIFLMVFNFTSSIMGGGYVVGALGGNDEISMYGVAFFGLGNACTFAFATELGSRFGRIQVLRAAVLLFFLFMFFCGYASTFFLFVLMRFFAGAACGVFFPLSLSLINECMPEPKKNKSLAFLAALMTVTPVLGACFGGWIAYDFVWSFIFYSQLPFIALALLLLCLHKAKAPPPILEKKTFDWTGFIFYLFTIGSFVSAISLGEQLDWFRSPLTCTLLGTSCITALFFIMWEWNHESPFMDLTLFKIPVFSISVFSVSFLFSAYFGMIILLSLWLHQEVNYTPLWIALLIAHMLIAGAVLFFVLEKWLKKTTSFSVVALAVAFFAISCFYSTFFNAEINFGRLAIARIFAGLGLAFFLFPLLLLCLNALPKEKESEGLAIFQSARLLSGSLGSVVYATVWFRRKIFYHDRLGEQLTAYSQQTDQFFSQVSFYGFAEPQSNSLLEKALIKQASALALADCFYLMGWIMIAILIVILFYLFTKKWIFKSE